MSSFHKTVGPVPIGTFNIGAAASAAAIAPLLAQLNLVLVDPFGLGALKADFVSQFKANLNFSVSFADPIAALKAAISGVLSVVSSLQASLALGIPALGMQVSASLGLAAALSAKLAGINALMDLTLGVRLAGVNFLAQLSAALSAGPVVAYGWSGITTSDMQTQIASYNFLPDGFAPLDTVDGVMLVTKNPSAFAGMQFMFVTG
jgi:hypothetical protein